MSDIVSANRATAGLSDEERAERARLAVKNFRAMQPSLTGFARALTGKQNVRVELDTGAPRTDGSRIFFRPPLAMGDPLKHDRMRCDRRGNDARLLCDACRVREEVLVVIYHEISHIAFDSFAPTLEQHKVGATQRAIEEWGSKYAEQIKQRLDSIPMHLKNDYKSLAGIISPFLPGIVNALEDARVNSSMFRARPGVRVMMKAHVHGLMSDGIEQADGSVTKWSDAPLNAQVVAGVFILGAGYGIEEDWFHPEVTEALADADLVNLCHEAGEQRRAADVYDYSFRVLARLRELGFCRREEDPEDEEPSDGPDEENEDSEPDDSPEPDDSDASDRDGEPDPGDGAEGEDDADDAGSDGGEPDPEAEAEGSEVSAEAEGDEAGAEAGSDDEAASEVSDESGDSGESGEAGDPTDGTGEDVPESDDGGVPSADSDSEGTVDEGSEPEAGDGVGAGPEDSVPDESGTEPGDVASEEEASSPGVGDSDPGESGEGSDEPGDEAEASDSEAGTPEAGGPDGAGEDLDGGELNDDTGEPEERVSDSDAVPSEDAGAGEPGEGSEDADGPGDGDPQQQDGEESAPEGGSPDADSEGSTDDGPNREAEDPQDGGLAAVGGGESSEPDATGSSTDEGVTDGEPDGGVDQDGEGSAESDFDPTISDGEVEGESALGDPDQPRTDEPEPTEDEDPFDMGGDEGYGGTQVTYPEPPESGDPEDVETALRLIENHERPPSQMEGPEDEDAIDQAIIQGMYFETPSTEVYGVRIHREGEPGLNDKGEPCDNAWNHSRVRDAEISDSQAGITGDFEVAETVLGKALLHTRRVFQDNQQTKYQPNLRSGRVNARVLGRRAWHDDDRLFGKKRVPGKRSYAVLIGVDVSGSTAGVNLVLAKRAAMAQAELCHRAGVQFAVYAHTLNNSKGQPYESDGMMLDIYEVKTWDEPWDPQRKNRLTTLGPDGGNLDGHTLEFYRKRLDEMDATDKILLYYTDGRMPASNYDEELEILQREIRTCKAKGYALLGVGIRTDSPIRHGLDTVRVDDDSNLKDVIAHLEKRLAGSR